MANKGKKKRNSKDSSGNGSTSEIVETTSKKKGGKKKSANKGKSFQCDIFNDAAMDNAYYVCHNVQVSLVKYK